MGFLIPLRWCLRSEGEKIVRMRDLQNRVSIQVTVSCSLTYFGCDLCDSWTWPLLLSKISVGERNSITVSMRSVNK